MCKLVMSNLASKKLPARKQKKTNPWRPASVRLLLRLDILNERLLYVKTEKQKHGNLLPYGTTAHGIMTFRHLLPALR